MTQEDVIRLARQANATEIGHKPPAFHFYMNDLETFAKLVAEKERESCAKECWKQMGMIPIQPWTVNPYEECAKAIRARGQA